jgi:hypothetical protein
MRLFRRQLLDAVSQAGGGAAAITRDAVGARTRAASDDIVRVLDDVLGVPQGENEIITAIRTGSAPARNAAYDAAYAVPIDYAAPQGRALESLYGRIPASAWRRADALMQLDGDQSMQRLMQIAPDGTVTLSALPDVRQLDYITRALNDVAAEADGQGKLGGTTDLGRATGALSRQIRQVLRRAVPEYGTALDTAADAISQRNAVETGYNLLATRIRREDVAEALHGASQAERAAARQGLRAYLDDTKEAIDHFKNFFDSYNGTYYNITNALSDYGYSMPKRFPEQDVRRFLRDHVDIIKRVGTFEELILIFRMIGIDVEIMEAWVLDPRSARKGYLRDPSGVLTKVPFTNSIYQRFF